MTAILQFMLYAGLIAGLLVITIYVLIGCWRGFELQMLDIRLRRQLANKDYNAALSTIQQKLKLQPADAYFYFQRARIFALTGDFNSAETDYTFGMKFSQGAVAYAGRAAARLSLGRLREALIDANHTIACSRSWWRGYYERGRVYKALGHYKVAIEDFNQAIELNRWSPPEIFLERAAAADFLGDMEAARRDRQRAAEVSSPGQ